MQVEQAQNNAQLIVPQVETWLSKAADINNNMTGVVNEIPNLPSGCLAIKSRFLLSKRAKMMTEEMKELRNECKFSEISQPPPSAATVTLPSGTTYDFESRKQIEEKIMMTLRDDKSITTMGIWGMGGLGKTTMAKRIMNRGIEEHLFDEVVIAVVSQQVNKLGIQDDIAIPLGLSFEKEGNNLIARAHKLRKRLASGKKILIVLDDVWESLELHDLGIPLEGGGCRILLTSRNNNTFTDMNVQKYYTLKVLRKTEAWDLFKLKVGAECIDCENVRSIAKDVVQECKGLPIALVMVGSALKDKKNISIWNDTLQQLKSANPKDLPKILDGVYKPLRVSYDLLKSENAKSLFLLCCLYREDYNIPLDDLVVHAVGLRMYEGIWTLKDARNRTVTLIEMLKSHSLLLDDSNEGRVRMHDVVRDVAIFIASEERLIKCNDCTWISSLQQGESIELTIGLNFPNLRLLLINYPEREESRIDDNYFEEISGLNVLHIRNYSISSSLPSTLQLLTNLRTLILFSCESLESISVVGDLLNLDILICHSCHSIEELPEEIGKLKRLKKLEFSFCFKLKTIVPGVISSLVGLEELKMVWSFDNWSNAGLRELESLSNLIRLEIEVRDYNLAAEQIRLPISKMVKYDIKTGDRWGWGSDEDKMACERRMFLTLPREITLGSWIHEGVRSAEAINITGEVSDDIFLDLGQASKNLRFLRFRKCSTVKKLMNITPPSPLLFPLLEFLKLQDLPNLEEICNIEDGLIPEGSSSSISSNYSTGFKNLKTVYLRNLPALKHFLWKNSPYQNNDCPLQLENVHISDCEIMEQVLLWNNEEEGNAASDNCQIKFPKLKTLELDSLPRLTAFCKGIQSIEFPLLNELKISDCSQLKSDLISNSTSVGNTNDENNNWRGHSIIHDDSALHLFCKPEKVAFGSLKKLRIDGYKDISKLWCNHIPVGFFTRLEHLTIVNCGSIKILFSFSIAGNLVNLKRLFISECKEMVKLIEKEKDASSCGGDKLENFCQLKCSLELPSLEQLTIYGCPQLGRFGLASSNYFQNLKDLSLYSFPAVKHISPYQNNVVSVLGNNLNDLFSLAIANDSLLQLESLVIGECEMMEQVFLWNIEEEGGNIDDSINREVESSSNRRPAAGDKKKIFPKLKTLNLYFLPRLTAFCKGIDQSIEFPLLTDMTIKNCPQLKNSFVCDSISVGNNDSISVGNNQENDRGAAGTINNTHDDDDDNDNDSDSTFHMFCNPEKVTISSFREKLWIDGYEDISKLWCHHIPIDFFKGLGALWIDNCDNIKSSFSSSIAQNLVNLRSLRIAGCREMVKVIEEEEKDDASSCGGGESTTIRLFPKLQSLELVGLYKLEFFCDWKYALELPSLEDVRICNCPKMERFSLGSLSTPNLRYIYYTDTCIKIKDDLNGTLQQELLRVKEEKVK